MLKHTLPTLFPLPVTWPALLFMLVLAGCDTVGDATEYQYVGAVSIHGYHEPIGAWARAKSLPPSHSWASMVRIARVELTLSATSYSMRVEGQAALQSSDGWREESLTFYREGAILQHGNLIRFDPDEPGIVAGRLAGGELVIYPRPVPSASGDWGWLKTFSELQFSQAPIVSPDHTHEQAVYQGSHVIQGGGMFGSSRFEYEITLTLGTEPEVSTDWKSRVWRRSQGTTTDQGRFASSLVLERGPGFLFFPEAGRFWLPEGDSLLAQEFPLDGVRTANLVLHR